MASARLRKIVGDLRASPSRTALVALSIAIGVTAVGMVAGARTLMLRTLDASRDEGRFPSATLRAEAFPPDALAAVLGVPGVVDAEARRVVGARLLGDGTLSKPSASSYLRSGLASGNSVLEPGVDSAKPGDIRTDAVR